MAGGFRFHKNYENVITVVLKRMGTTIVTKFGVLKRRDKSIAAI